MKKKTKIILGVVLLLIVLTTTGLYLFTGVDLCVVKFSLKYMGESNIYCMACTGQPSTTNGVTAQRCGMWSLRNLEAIVID